MSLKNHIESAALYSLYGYAATSLLSVAVSNIFLVLGVICSLFIIKERYKLMSIPRNYLIAIFIFFAVGFLSVCISENFADSFNRYMKYLLRLSMVFLVLIAVQKPVELKKILYCIIFSAALSAVIAIYQGLSGNYRADVFFSNPMYYAGFLVQIIPILLVLVINKSEHKYYYSTVFLCLLLALLFNGTRGAWLSMLVLLPLVMILCKINLKKLFAVFLTAVMVLSILFTVNESFNNRIQSFTSMKYQSNSERLLLWQSAVNMWKDNPVFGVGVGNFEKNYREKYISPEAKERGLGHPHNNFLGFLSEMGLVGASTYLIYIGTFLYGALKNWFATRNIYALFLFSATLGLFLQGLTESNFGNSVVMNFYYLLLGIFFVSIRINNNYRVKE